MNSIYMFYLILGWRMTQISEGSLLKNKPHLRLLIIGLLSLLLLICCYYIFAKGVSVLTMVEEYNSPVEVALGIMIFITAYSYKDRFVGFTSNQVIKSVNKDSFGIYVFHMLWVNVLYKVFKFNPLDYNYLVFIPIILLILVLSILTTEIFRRIPLIGKYI